MRQAACGRIDLTSRLVRASVDAPKSNRARAFELCAAVVVGLWCAGALPLTRNRCTALRFYDPLVERGLSRCEGYLRRPCLRLARGDHAPWRPRLRGGAAPGPARLGPRAEYNRPLRGHGG